MKASNVTFFKDFGFAYSKAEPCNPFTGQIHKIVFLCFGIELVELKAYRGKEIK
jgi:hypothetical protein